MGEMSKALESLKKHQGSWERRPVISFADFLQEVITHPERNIRNVYQIYVDMINAFICEGVDEYINDAESINYLDYNCNRLFVEGSDRPAKLENQQARLELLKTLTSRTNGCRPIGNTV